MARLILSKDGRERTIELPTTPVVLGRASDCTIVIEDNAASKRHCALERAGDAYVVRDLGSTNGTFLNDRPVVGDAPLRHGDELVVGDTLVRFEEGYAVGSSVAPPPAADGVVLARVKLRRKQVAPSPNPTSAPPPRPPARRSGPPSAPPALEAVPESSTQRIALDRPPPSSASSPAVRGSSPTGAPPDAGEAHRLGLASGPDASVVDADGSRVETEQLRAFSELTRTLLSIGEPLPLLEALLRGALRLAPLERGVLFVVDASGTLAPRLACDRRGAASAASVSEAVVASAVKRRVAAIAPGPKGAEAAAVPIVWRDALRGVLWVEAVPATRLGESDVALLELAASQAAAVVGALAAISLH
jgi:pSer/pThr/pTyr-binding forkhead associated (FHA) protein